MHRYFAGPRGVHYVGSGLIRIVDVDFYRIDTGVRRCPLGHHQGDDAGAGSYIQYALRIFHVAPRAHQYRVSAYLQAGVVVIDGELFEPESAHNYGKALITFWVRPVISNP